MNLRMMVHRADNFVCFNAMSPNFDLVIYPPEKGDLAVGQEAAEVSRLRTACCQVPR
jgi:hypothetical protein